MRPVDRARWLVRFDMEHLVSAVLRNGTAVSVGAILLALILQWTGHGSPPVPRLQAKSLPILWWEDLRMLGVPGLWPTRLVHLGVSALLLTPYLRVVASFVYFVWVDRHWKHAAFTGAVLIMLTLALLTTLV